MQHRLLFIIALALILIIEIDSVSRSTPGLDETEVGDLLMGVVECQLLLEFPQEELCHLGRHDPRCTFDSWEVTGCSIM